ncbi:MAG: hypothetical protein K0Q63_2802 [Paenibacillus sp.]|nr:hypothetical protein [Paenibacillus sp.]
MFDILIRASERILVPERGARLCNFEVVNVNERDTWVTVAEWMQNGGASGKEMRRRLLLTHTPRNWPLSNRRRIWSGLIALWVPTTACMPLVSYGTFDSEAFT